MSAQKKSAQTAQNKKATNYEMFCEAYAAMGPPMPSDKRRSNRIWLMEFEKMSECRATNKSPKSLTKPALRENEDSREFEQKLARETRSQYTVKHLHREPKPQIAITTSPECVCKKWRSSFAHSPDCKAIDISY